jgi:enamine deaminase RidA (YjgF/YER057c/UK114 family)
MADNAQQQPQQKNNYDKLEELLQFNPSKPPKVTNQVLGEALKEIQEEQAKEAKANAKTLLTQAMELAKKRETAKKAFLDQDRKFDKELGKFMNKLNAYINGKEPEPENPQAEADNAA